MKVLIIGFGIAGCVLAEKLLQKNIKVDVMDAGEKYCASLTGAGIINPITGKRLVLDPDFNIFYDHATQFYKNWSEKNDLTILKAKKYFRVLTEELAFYRKKKLELPEYQKYLTAESSILDSERYDGQEVFEIFGVSVLDFQLFQEAQKKKIKNMMIGMEDFIYQKSSSIEKLPAVFEDYDAVFLAEGSLAFRNPFLQKIAWVLAKGETLIVQIPDLKEDRFLHSDIFLLPLSQDLYKIGTNYQWDNLDFLPTENVKLNLLDLLRKFCKKPIELIEHRAGIRPITKDRRPILGKINGFESFFVINGLGSKGALMAPYCSDLLIEHWLEGATIPEKWSVDRFY